MTARNLFYAPPANCQVPELGRKWEAIFGRRTEGFFVEVGAYDGENFSNTSCLADAGWAGLYIEPIVEFAEKCRARHAKNSRVSVLNCAASDKAGNAEIFIGDTLTTLVGDQVADYEKIDWAKGLHRGESRQIKTELLDTILENESVPVDFDVLVVDVEGAEERVIGGFDIARWNSKVILIELEDEHPDFKVNTRIVSAAAAIRQKVAGHGYSIFFKDHINSLYVRNDILARAQLKNGALSFEPAVSVGMPIYNRADMLAQAVRSIREQSFSDFELVISDNCSPDPAVAKLCTTLAEEDDRITYIRQSSNVGPTRNFLTVLKQTSGPLFMWASDDDFWAKDFLLKATNALNSDPSISAWMCHIDVIDSTGEVVRSIPNLRRFSSTSNKRFDLGKFLAQPECLGKANLFYSVFRRAMLAEVLKKVTPYLNDWGADMIAIYAFLCRGNIKVDPVVSFSKRLAARELGFEPVVPRRNIVPWQHAARYYGAMIDVASDTTFHDFTKVAVRARYLYDVLYWRLKLRTRAPWRPSQGVVASAETVPFFVEHEVEDQPAQTMSDDDAATKKRFMNEFRDSHYIRHNQRRQEHLASLGLPIEGRSVLELGAGIGDHTTFFIDRNCSICVSDGRQELYEIIRERYSWMRTELLDLERPDPAFQDKYEIVYAYGLLYHLQKPASALETMAYWCSDMLLLETAVSPLDDVGENLVAERSEYGSQAVSGTGSRPSRKWVFEKLKTLFPYVYVTQTQPWHPEFPLDWDNPPVDTGYTRAVFVASRTPLILPTLSPQIMSRQVRH